MSPCRVPIGLKVGGFAEVGPYFEGYKDGCDDDEVCDKKVFHKIVSFEL